MVKGETYANPELPTCPQCGWFIFPNPTPLQLADHDVRHLRHAHIDATFRNQPIVRSELALMIRLLDKLVAAYEDERLRLTGVIMDLEDERAVLIADIIGRDELIEDLRADAAKVNDV